MATVSCSQPKNNEKEKNLDKIVVPIIEDFFAKIQSGEYKTAVDYLLGKNDNIDLRDSFTIRLREKFNNLNETSGSYISSRLMRKKLLEDDLGVYSYLVKYDKKFYRFVFVFYNNSKTVKIYRFSFDDTIDIELEEGIKLYVN
jgi:hypothetical protein